MFRNNVGEPRKIGELCVGIHNGAFVIACSENLKSDLDAIGLRRIQIKRTIIDCTVIIKSFGHRIYSRIEEESLFLQFDRDINRFNVRIGINGSGKISTWLWIIKA